MNRLVFAGIVLALAPAVSAQSVAHGFEAGLFTPAVVQDDHVLGSMPLATGDLNEDGRADLVACDQEPLLLDRFLGQASGGVGDWELIALPGSVGPYPRALIGDLNGDGHLDLLVHGTINGNVVTLPGLGDGSFGAAITATTLPMGSFALNLSDSDEDGVLDLQLATGSGNPSTLLRLPGLGDGSFGAAVTIGQAAFPTQLVVNDFDLDGVPDLACLDSSSVAVRLGLGGGAFGPPQEFSSFAAFSLASTDMDVDGLPDLIHGSATDVGTILHGLGGGDFGESQSIPFVQLLERVLPADLDRDGVPDLMALGNFPVVAMAQRMDPQGPVGGAQSFTLPIFLGAGSLVAQDFDGDGLVDFATTDYSDPELITMSNALGPIVDLGYGLSTVMGTPKLVGSGVPQAGSFVIITAIAPASSTGLLVVGLQTLDAPFLGSTLVPEPAFVVGLPGTTMVQGFWPAGFPLGQPVYLQSAWSLPGGGKSISNALMIVPE